MIYNYLWKAKHKYIYSHEVAGPYGTINNQKIDPIVYSKYYFAYGALSTVTVNVM